MSELEAARTLSSLAGLDNVSLLETMLGLLMPFEGAPMFGGQTVIGATVMRLTFLEVAARFVPPDVFAPAFRSVSEGGGVEGSPGQTGKQEP